jgi:septal ring factor EnvC (AmiA/AmiB activator)
MTDAFGAPKPDRTIGEIPLLDAEAAGATKNLTVLPPPAHVPRDSRPVTNLGRVFGQFAELQQQIAEQVVALEDSVHQQKQDLAAAMAQLPELRERINWLIASFYEQSKKDESVRDRLNRHDAAIEGLTETVRYMQEQQARWQAAFDEVIAGLVRAKAAFSPRD